MRMFNFTNDTTTDKSHSKFSELTNGTTDTQRFSKYSRLIYH